MYKQNNFIKGHSNYVEGSNNFINGSNNRIDGSKSACFLMGDWLIAGKKEQIVVGCANEIDPNAQFIVASGTYDQNRKNAFVVKTDGSARIQTASTEKDAVVQYSQLETLLNKISELEARIEELENGKVDDNTPKSSVALSDEYSVYVEDGKMILGDKEADSYIPNGGLVLADMFTGIKYSVIIENDKITLSDEVDAAATAKDSITLIDKSTNVNYVIGVINGKLTMEVTE